MKTYRALPAPSPCRQSLAPQTWGCPPAPVAKVIHLRLVDEKNRVQDRQTDRQSGRQAGRQTKRKGEGHWKERYKNQRLNELLNISLHSLHCTLRASLSDTILQGRMSFVADRALILQKYLLYTRAIHYYYFIFVCHCAIIKFNPNEVPLSHYAIIIITE